MRRSFLWGACLVALVGCGTLADNGGGADNLPNSGAGPFTPLDGTLAKVSWSAPYALASVDDLGDPWILTAGDAIALWVTARPHAPATGPTRIEHADLYALKDGFGESQVALEADRAWEAGGVAAPSVIFPSRAGRPWLLFYAAGGALGLASATDGHSWVKRDAPILLADTVEEGAILGSPAAVRLPASASVLGVDVVRLYYLAGGAVWAAEAPADALDGGDATFTRLDADPTTPGRDPVLKAGAVPFLVDYRRVTARAVPTPAGRLRHDLFVGGWNGQRGSTDPTSVLYQVLIQAPGFASSYDGLVYDTNPLPMLPIRVRGGAPMETKYAAAPAIDAHTAGGALLFYVDTFGGRDAIAIGVAP